LLLLGDLFKLNLMNESGILRQCAACKRRTPKSELLRAVKFSDGRIEFDETHTKEGRGAYCCALAKCLLAARKNDLLGAVLHDRTPADVYLAMAEQVRRSESADPGAMLGFAVRSGKVVFGSQALEQRLKSGGIRLLLVSAEASPNTQDRMIRIAEAAAVRCIVLPASFSLETVTGRPNCRVAGVTDPQFANRIGRAFDGATG
jgi:uncharacterized protein